MKTLIETYQKKVDNINDFLVTVEAHRGNVVTRARERAANYRVFIADLKARQDAYDDLIQSAKSLVLSVMAHPDYTGEEDAEWTDFVDSVRDAIDGIKTL